MTIETDWITAISGIGSAVGTIGAVGVALWFSQAETRRRKREERSRQAEQISAWLEIDDFEEAEKTERTHCVVSNGSNQLVYDVVVSLVAVHGAFRRTAVGVDRNGPQGGYQTYVGGPFPPGRQTLTIGYRGSALQVRYGVELAFRDARGRYWIRDANGDLKEVLTDPLVLYGSGRPGLGPGAIEIHGRPC
jgi:hypothetical protein